MNQASLHSNNLQNDNLKMSLICTVCTLGFWLCGGVCIFVYVHHISDFWFRAYILMRYNCSRSLKLELIRCTDVWIHIILGSCQLQVLHVEISLIFKLSFWRLFEGSNAGWRKMLTIKLFRYVILKFTCIANPKKLKTIKNHIIL